MRSARSCSASRWAWADTTAPQTASAVTAAMASQASHFHCFSRFMLSIICPPAAFGNSSVVSSFPLSSSLTDRPRASERGSRLSKPGMPRPVSQRLTALSVTWRRSASSAWLRASRFRRWAMSAPVAFVSIAINSLWR